MFYAPKENPLQSTCDIVRLGLPFNFGLFARTPNTKSRANLATNSSRFVVTILFKSPTTPSVDLFLNAYDMIQILFFDWANHANYKKNRFNVWYRREGKKKFLPCANLYKSPD